MFKKIFKSVDKFLKRSDKRTEDKRRLSKKCYALEQSHISNNAIDTIKKLQKAGYEAYLVGGCIRDLLLSIQPKDFDVATNATPEQVKKVIRNSRIIGRRFKLVHAFWGRETIEVATFRGPHNVSNDTVQQGSGRILRDNVYGTMDQDAQRRDFTINAFYYDLSKKKVVDPADGLNDIKNKTIRVIGDPAIRYQEDPVRMLRAIRFAAKLDFRIEPRSEAPIYQLSYLLAGIPAARLFDEVLKLFLSGKALRVFELLNQYNLFKVLFPKVADVLAASPTAELFIRQALTNTDERLNTGKTVNPAFLYATLLWPSLCNSLGHPWSEKLPNLIDLQALANELITEQSKYTTIPKRFSIPMREIWEAQIRLAKRQGNKADLLLSHPRFRAGYDFLLLRESTGEDTGGLGAWWTEYQQLDDLQRREMMRALFGGKKTGRKRHRYKPKAKRATLKVSKEIVYIGIGSNLNNPVEQVKSSMLELACLPESCLIKQSSIYCSDSLLAGQPQYINAVVSLQTVLSAEVLLDHLQQIEHQHGRERKEKWQARTLDLDIILYGQHQIQSDRLTIPHTQLAFRSFVLVPLLEIAPDLIIPSCGAISLLVENCPSQNLTKYKE